jgi:hypothetical protein
MISRSTVTEFLVTISGSAFVECVWQFHVVAINLFLLSIWCLGRAVDSTRQLSLRFQLWFQGLLRLCFHLRFLVTSYAVSLAIPCVNDDSVFCIDFMHQSWISVRCRFHQSAATQFSKMISRSTVTQFSVTISWWAFGDCVSQFHVLAMDLFLLSIWCLGRAVDSTRQLSLRFQLWLQGLQRLCFRWLFMVTSDAASLAIPFVNDDSVFSIDFMRQSWISVRCRFHQSPATQFSKMISRSTGTYFSVTISGWALAESVLQFHT